METLKNVAISDLRANEIGVIVDVNLSGRQLKRMLELGFVNGTRIKISAISPDGQTFLVAIRGYLLAIDVRVGEKIIVRRV